MFADGCQLTSIARKIAVMTMSSGETEFYGLPVMAAMSMALKELIEWLGFKVLWTVKTDASAAKSMALRERFGRARHMDTRALWVQQAAKY